PLEKRAGEFDPLPDRHDDVGLVQAFREVIEIARRLAIAPHVVVADEREARELIDDVLIIVGNDDLHQISYLPGAANVSSVVSDDEIQGICSPLVAFETPIRVRMNASSAAMAGARISLSNSVINRPDSSPVTFPGAAAYITSVPAGVVTGASPTETP